jgi:TPR repeat protein
MDGPGDASRAEAYYREALALDESLYGPFEESLSIPLLKKASELGHLEATFLLGQRYYHYGVRLEEGPAGGGPLQDELRDGTARFLTEAADRGHPRAMWYLSRCLSEGRGMERDMPRCLKLLIEAVGLDDPCAQLDLATRHLAGDGVPRDDDMGLRLLERSAKNGLPTACDLLGLAYSSGKYGLAPDKAKALAWWGEGARLGSGASMTSLASAYTQGDGVPRDFEKAVSYLQDAVKQEVTPREAFSLLGVCYYAGMGVERDHKQAVRHLMVAAEAGSALAVFYLGVCCHRGHGVPVDTGRAVELFREARIMGDPTTAKLLEEFLEAEGITL